jgi:hypothetical protein
MSLISYLNADSLGSSSTSSQVTQALATIAAKKAAATSTDTTTETQSSGTSVNITVQARRAAAEKADASKTAAALATELRKSLDADYAAAGKKNSSDLTAQSGRALATIALNESGQFSKSEIAAAKLELRARDRQSILAEINAGPLTAASLAAYSKQMMGARATMSVEERSLRDANPNIR